MAIYAGGKRIDGGGGGGSGFLLGPETNQFTSTTARDTYATNDAAWLSEYDGNPGFLVQVTVGGTATYYRRNNSAWEDVGGIIGITASQAAINAAVAAAVIDFRTQAQITTEIDAAIVAGVMGFQTAAQITASITAALSNYLTASDVAALIQTGITSLGLLDTATLSDGTLSLALTQGVPITADGFVEITGGTSAPDDADAITGRNQFYINTTDSVLYYSLPSNDTWSKSGHTDVTTGHSQFLRLPHLKRPTISISRRTATSTIQWKAKRHGYSFRALVAAGRAGLSITYRQPIRLAHRD